MTTPGRLDAALAGRYVVDRELGRGGMATVYLVNDLRHDRQVALKVLDPDLGAMLGGERFLREIRVTAKLQHPNLLPLFDSGEADGLLFYTMPYVEGESLRARLARERQLPVEDAVRIATAIAGALDYAHRHGIIHRDLKPENILIHGDRLGDERSLGGGGQPLVADFGIALAVTEAGGARMTQTGLSLGTPHYMSPEQAAGDRVVDGRTDIYSLGAMLYEMLTGEPPHTGPTMQAVIARLMTEPPRPIRAVRPAVPEHIAVAIDRALAKVVADRWPTAAQFGEALNATGVSRRTSDASPLFASPQRRRARAWRVWVGAGICVGVVAALVAYRALASPRSPVGDSASIAVLPFVDLSAQRDKEYLSDGLTEELIDALSRVQRLRVISRTSSFAFKGKSADARDVARALGVGSLLEGSVQRDGKKLRVTAKLIDAHSGFSRWSRTFEREMADVFAVQDEITRTIAQELEVGLTDAPRSSLVSHTTANLDAYTLYLQGRYFWNQRSGTSLAKAITYFERSIAADSTYAPAFAGLADTYNVMGGLLFSSPAVAFPKAKAAASRAIALDSTLAEAHAALAFTHLFGEWDGQGTRREVERALALDPNYATARLYDGFYLLAVGKIEEAVIELRRARVLDPLSLIINTRLGDALLMEHRFDEAAVAEQHALELDSTFAPAVHTLGLAYVFQGKLEQALSETERVRRQPGQPLGGDVGYIYAAAGKSEAARQLLAELEARARSDYVDPYDRALVYAGLGNRDSAFRWLETAREQHSTSMILLRGDPMLDGLRSDPRFAELVKRVGL